MIKSKYDNDNNSSTCADMCVLYKYIILGPIRGGGPSVLIRKTSSPSVSLIDTFAGTVTALQVSDYSQRGCKR